MCVCLHVDMYMCVSNMIWGGSEWCDMSEPSFCGIKIDREGWFCHEAPIFPVESHLRVSAMKEIAKGSG